MSDFDKFLQAQQPKELEFPFTITIYGTAKATDSQLADYKVVTLIEKFRDIDGGDVQWPEYDLTIGFADEV